ncbi:uncharacterized protein AB675_4044 [Cyphellophora attinorum]|uniref:Essential protein Yae1 N-terminal domain-containing protein n=1 Tax=Cyphellophora attinorum TaxID=1664694 RepID=A0A0N1H0R1_9EURO|nr:uncharacterized protein AB675_4044 [Phialophora attinorum]KPI37593.1 hypothetical protein AB675_4044 [Phialophora attinorum]
MADDLFDDVLDIEDQFYKEGFDAGAADGTHAGLVEGKIFGIEKGYDKALELGRLHGRALVWNHRLRQGHFAASGSSNLTETTESSAQSGTDLSNAFSAMPALPKSARLEKNVESLLSLTSPKHVPTANDDESVEKVEDLIMKATNKAKIVSNTVGEPHETSIATVSSIEDSGGLSARH